MLFLKMIMMLVFDWFVLELNLETKVSFLEQVVLKKGFKI
jgi:hypothetical protein